jgi:hypothetical protein
MPLRNPLELFDRNSGAKFLMSAPKPKQREVRSGSSKHGIGRYVRSWEDSGLLVLWPSLSAQDPNRTLAGTDDCVTALQVQPSARI